ncbi:MAG: hypothetical protein H7Y05_04535 [Steroidobacteraceae bacterium]|nr:hypothetical protein [Deltaproteobacteria bacterium]
MTNKSCLTKGMGSPRRLILLLTVAVMMAVPYHAKSEWPQTDEPPAMIDPSQPDFLKEMQPQSDESVPPPVPPVEAPVAVETPVEVPAPTETPTQIPDGTPVPVEAPAEAPAENPVEAPAEATPATETPAPEAAPEAP